MLPSGAGAGDRRLAGRERVRVAYQVRAPEPYRAPTERDAAAEWLVEYLESAGKPVAPKIVIAAAEEAGFSRTVLYRAREALEGAVMTTGALRSASSCWQIRPATAAEGTEEMESVGSMIFGPDTEPLACAP